MPWSQIALPVRLTRIALVVGLILCIPLIGTYVRIMYGIGGWYWTFLDFAVMGTLLFITGLFIDLAVRKITDPLYRIITVAAIVFVLLVIWAQLAVGAVSQLIEGVLQVF